LASNFIPGFRNDSVVSTTQGFTLTFYNTPDKSDFNHTLVIQDLKQHNHVCILDINEFCIGSLDSTVYTLDIPSGDYIYQNYDNTGNLVKQGEFTVAPNSFIDITNIWHV
jgi:hypothetical protein